MVRTVQVALQYLQLSEIENQDENVRRNCKRSIIPTHEVLFLIPTRA